MHPYIFPDSYPVSLSPRPCGYLGRVESGCSQCKQCRGCSSVMEVMEAVLTLLLAASSLASPVSAAAGLTLRNRHNQNF